MPSCCTMQRSVLKRMQEDVQPYEKRFNGETRKTGGKPNKAQLTLLRLISKH